MRTEGRMRVTPSICMITRRAPSKCCRITDFIAGGSKDELTTRRNRTAFDAISLRPRFLRDVPSASWRRPCWGPYQLPRHDLPRRRP